MFKFVILKGILLNKGAKYAIIKQNYDTAMLSVRQCCMVLVYLVHS